MSEATSTMSGEQTAILKIREVVMVSVPADPDDRTISDLQDRVLRSMERHGARGLVLDISTVDTLDSFFARTIAETAQMVSLMGGQTVIAGMRAPVAITAAQLGVALGGIATALDVDRALDLLAEGV